MKTKFLLSAILIFIAVLCNGQIINVPGDQPTIQAGINVASTGDVVLVQPGTYYENISFKGKAITVKSHFDPFNPDSSLILNTIINGSQPLNNDSAAVVMFVEGEDTTSILQGFTITGGTGIYYSFFQARGGGGIALYNSGAKIINNIITTNQINHPSTSLGGGIAAIVDNGENWVVIKENKILNNSTTANNTMADGGGVFVGINGIIQGNFIGNNEVLCEQSDASGGGIELWSQPTSIKTVNFNDNVVRNNTVEGYNAYGGGLFNWKTTCNLSNNDFITNSVFSQNNSKGGGILITQTLEEIHIVNNTVMENTLTGSGNSYGAGISIDDNVSKISILNNNINFNNILLGNNSYGGGIYISGSSGILEIQNNYIHNNSVSGNNYCYGAGLWIYNPYEKIEILNNQIYYNELIGNSFAGAVGLTEANEVEIEISNNLIYNNISDDAGGFLFHESFNININNNVFYSNSSENTGGAIRFLELSENMEIFSKIDLKNLSVTNYDDIRPLIVNNTFINNNSSDGGAIYCNYSESVPIIMNSIFYDNVANSGCDIYYQGSSSIPVYYSCIDTSVIVGQWLGNGNIDINPEFVEGDSLFHLSEYSQCINSGVDSVEIQGTVYFAPNYDYDNDIRPFDTTNIDIGADESQYFNFITSSNVYKNSSTDLLIRKVYPNPITNNTNIQFSVPQMGIITLKVYDVQGNHLETLLSEKFNRGIHQYLWNTNFYKPGIYFIILYKSGESGTKKVLIQ